MKFAKIVIVLGLATLIGITGCQSSKPSKPIKPKEKVVEKQETSSTPVLVATVPNLTEKIDDPTEPLAHRFGLWEERARITYPKNRTLVLYFRVHINGKLSMKHSRKVLYSPGPTKEKFNSTEVGVSLFDPDIMLPPKHHVSTCKIEFECSGGGSPQWIEYTLPEGHTACGFSSEQKADSLKTLDFFPVGPFVVEVMSCHKAMFAPAVADPKNPESMSCRITNMISVELFVGQEKKRTISRNHGLQTYAPFSNEGLPKYQR